MKKYLLACVAFAVACFSAQAQDINKVEHFDVGPYSVDYWGKGDIDFKLKDGVDLYEFFELKRDTVIVKNEEAGQAVKQAFWAGIQLTSRGGISQLLIGPQGGWKCRIAKELYFNAGLTLGLMFNRGEQLQSGAGKTTFITTIPLTLEWAKLARRKSTMFVELGVAPFIYAKMGGTSGAGFAIAPKGVVGAYIPVGNHFLKLGATAMVALGDKGGLSAAIGRTYLGYSLDFVF